jgi:hypothetical protein
MVNQNIIDYLRENKDKFSQEVLRKKLIEAGYPKDQIEEGIRIVYEKLPIPLSPPEAPRETSFWDFKSVKIYTNFGEKLLDFLAGFFAPIIIGWGISWLLGISAYFMYPSFGFRWILSLGILIAQIFGIFYFWKRRHYFARGLLFCLILLSILIIIGLFLLFFGLGALWYH